jgi:hypothetical protein
MLPGDFTVSEGHGHPLVGFNFSTGVQYGTLRNGECSNPKQVEEPYMQLKGDDSPHNKVHMMAKSQGCMLCVNPWTYLRVGYHGQLSSHVKRFIPFIRSTVGNTVHLAREDCRSFTK